MATDNATPAEAGRTEGQRHYDEIMRLEGELTSVLDQIP